jgi:hypothetical protein
MHTAMRFISGPPLQAYHDLVLSLAVAALVPRPQHMQFDPDRKQEAYDSVRGWRLGAAEAIEATPAADISRGRLGDRCMSSCLLD